MSCWLISLEELQISTTYILPAKDESLYNLPESSQRGHEGHVKNIEYKHIFFHMGSIRGLYSALLQITFLLFKTCRTKDLYYEGFFDDVVGSHFFPGS